MARLVAYLAGGCFWGMQQLFRAEKGVITTEVGYCGGENDNPTYKHHPGHAETLKITYDDTKTSFVQLLDFFFRIHDPTTKNRQGNDIGDSYRSAIFYTTPHEEQQARAFIERVNARGVWKDPVVTSVEPFVSFHRAEDYHQDYLETHPLGYTCHVVRGKSLLT